MTKELADLGPKELGGATPLYIAVQNGYPNCVRKLLEAGVNVDPQTEAGSTPLMIAMYLADTIGDKPHIDCARLLLEAGASTTLKDKAGKTPLDWCGRDNSLIAMIRDEEEIRERNEKEGRRGFW
jgi:ankyrin repeat protein